MKDICKNDSIIRPRYVEGKQRSHSIIHLPCSMNVLYKQFRYSTSGLSQASSHLLWWQQAMILRQDSDPACYHNFKTFLREITRLRVQSSPMLGFHRAIVKDLLKWAGWLGKFRMAQNSG